MVHQLRISLIGSEPEIWRRFKVNSAATFEDLHDIIQMVMGWEDYHLFDFRNKELKIGLKPEDDFFVDEDLIRADEITISEVLLRKRSNIRYTYDFGDSWEHKIVVENILEDEVVKNPVCLAGAMNCPPEDCGGIWGYTDLCEIIKDQKHPGRAEMLEWLGGGFDPEYFNLKNINVILAKYKFRRNRKNPLVANRANCRLKTS